MKTPKKVRKVKQALSKAVLNIIAPVNEQEANRELAYIAKLERVYNLA